MKRIILALAVLAGCAAPVTPPAPGGAVQGWTVDSRRAFYSGDQGSRIMPASWMQALKQPDGSPFLADKLARYGYLANDAEPGAALPIGFTTNGSGADRAVGMTCAACHTREIQVKGVRHRIEGGPALVDFEAFLRDLRASVGKVRGEAAAFDAFAAEVLGAGGTAAAKQVLMRDLAAWEGRFSLIVDRSLGGTSWGTGRLDAISMIFNRLAGLDISPAGPDGVIEGNIAAADAPVRYPFLWDSARQDLTQWPGIAPNGDWVLGLVRNVGEVYGVFGDFHPTPDAQAVMKVDYATRNSANLRGLRALERLIEILEPPKYPWPVDEALAAQGRELFGTGAQQKGACWSCHGAVPGTPRLFNPATWDTKLMDVGTDNRQYRVLRRQADSGTMVGSGLAPLLPAVKPVDSVAYLLKVAVVGGILQKALPFTAGPELPGQAAQVRAEDEATLRAPANRSLRERLLARTELAKGLAQEAAPRPAAPGDGPFKYEARVLRGIWAAAPYLHNGSVPTLADLLEPADRRPAAFAVGPEYDPERVGLAAVQAPASRVMQTTTCEEQKTTGWASGNGRCGHEYGLQMTPAQKRALLEYLKTL